MNTARPRNEGVLGSAEKTTGVMRGRQRTSRLLGLLGSVLREVQFELLQRQAWGVTKEEYDRCVFVCMVMYVESYMSRACCIRVGYLQAMMIGRKGSRPSVQTSQM